MAIVFSRICSLATPPVKCGTASACPFSCSGRSDSLAEFSDKVHNNSTKLTKPDAYPKYERASTISEDRTAESRCSLRYVAVFDRRSAHARQQSDRVLAYGLFGHLFRCSRIRGAPLFFYREYSKPAKRV